MVPAARGGESRGWLLVHHYRQLRICPNLSLVRSPLGREHDIAFQGRKVGSSQKADAWLTPKGTNAVYDYREQELYSYDEYDAFADDEGVDKGLRADVADALGEKYVEELDI